MFRFTIRDVLWLTAVVGLGAGWWAERQAQEQALVKCEAARQAMQQAAELLGASLVESDGHIIGYRGAHFVRCPVCKSTIYVDQQPFQKRARDLDGNPAHSWCLKGLCVGCHQHFEYVLSPTTCQALWFGRRTRRSPNRPAKEP
jgi:hypothetical protein